jgi:hypothetical protein
MRNSSPGWLPLRAAVEDVFVDDAQENEKETEDTQHVRVGRELIAGTEERGQQLVHRQEHECDRERQE